MPRVPPHAGIGIERRWPKWIVVRWMADPLPVLPIRGWKGRQPRQGAIVLGSFWRRADAMKCHAWAVDHYGRS